MNATQLIYVCDRCEIADSSNSEVPEWPVQDSGGRWNYERFPGQRVAYSRAQVEFGFLANPMTDDEAASLDMDDLAGDVFVVGDDFFKAV
jgi:hypothetical protein